MPQISMKITSNYSKKKYKNLTIVITSLFHDRYIIIDEQCVYHLGDSLNGIGKNGIIEIIEVKDKDNIDFLNMRVKAIIKNSKNL